MVFIGKPQSYTHSLIVDIVNMYNFPKKNLIVSFMANKKKSASSLEVHALGYFSLSLAPLTEKIQAINIKMHQYSDAELLPRLESSDLLLCTLDWLETLTEVQQTFVLNKVNDCKDWIVITDDQNSLNQQFYWLGRGVRQFIHRSSSIEQLIETFSRNKAQVTAAPRVLLLSDAPHANQLSEALRGEELEVILSGEADHSLKILEQTKPDILVVELEDAFEQVFNIIQIARQWPATKSLPVLALLSENCAHQLRQANVLNAIDWIPMPLAADLIAGIVKQRINSMQIREQSILALVQERDRSRDRLKSFRSAIDQHAIVSVADVQGKILHVNQLFCKISGYSRSELIGNNHRILKSDVHPPEFYKKLWTSIRNGEPWRGEVCNRRKDGDLYWVDASIVPFLDERGNPHQYISIRTDITQHKASERALRISHKRLQLSQIAGRVGTWEFDFDTRTVQLSESIAGLLGYAEPLSNASYEFFLTLIHPNDLPLVPSSTEGLLSLGTSFEVEHRVIWPDGTSHWLLQRGLSECDASGRVVRILGITQDIHSRKISEQKLEESEERFRSAFDTSGIGMALIGLDGHWLRVNHALCETLGFSNEELLGLNFQAMTHPDDLANDINLINQFLRNEFSSQQFEKRYISKDGRTIIASLNVSLVRNIDLQPLHFVCQIQDITQRKTTEQRLTLFGKIFESSEQCISVADEQGHLIYQNTAQRNELGYTDTDCIGKAFNMLMADDDAKYSTMLWQNIAQGKNWQGYLPLRRKNGTEFISSSFVGLVKNEHSQAQYLFNIFTDFSTEIARRSELDRARAAADLANQAKSDFISSMSHELRTPMNAILGFAQILECDDGLDADQLDNVKEILKGGQHLLELINEILDLATIESGRLSLSIEPVSLEGILAECWKLVQPLAQTRHLSSIFSVPDNAIVQADRMRLKQVLLNLLSNAVKYNQDGGRISVTVNCHEIGKWRIEVTDNGMGIPSARIDELFQPFSRLDAKYSDIEGTGIGLTIARRLAGLMGGSIGVRSTEGQGSTFWLDLSAIKVNAPTIEAPTEKIIHTGNLAAQCVLCVDDNPINLKLINNYLEKNSNIKLITASSAELGLESAMAQHPDVILLDINMPGMDGYQLLNILKADPRTCKVPIIAVTANAMPADLERAQRAGFNDYITKPIDFHRLFVILDNYLNPTAKEF